MPLQHEGLALGRQVAVERVALGLRAGLGVGEHLVQFTGQGERIELVHRAMHRDIFARGALHAAAWLAGKPAGIYTIADMLGDKIGLDSTPRSR